MSDQWYVGRSLGALWHLADAEAPQDQRTLTRCGKWFYVDLELMKSYGPVPYEDTCSRCMKKWIDEHT